MKVRLSLLVALVAVGPAGAAFPGANGRIAYTKEVERSSEHCCHVFTVWPDGSDPRDLGEGREPAWSPDGRMLAVSDQSGGIWTMDASGGSRRRVASGSSPAWAPDGRRLVVSATRGDSNNLDLFVVDVATGEATRLTDGLGSDTAPDWSPDGGLIAYNYGSDLWTIAPDGSNARLLRQEALGPSWSPDGKSIAVITGGFITIVRRDGTVTGEHLRQAQTVSWSPDGRDLLFRGPNGVCIGDARGANAHGVVFGRVFDPDWQAGASGGAAPHFRCDALTSKLQALVTARPRTASIGDRITYAVSVTNRGPDPIPALGFTLRLPDGARLVAKRPRVTIGPCSFERGYFERTYSPCAAPDVLAPGEGLRLRFTMVAEEPGPLRVSILSDRFGSPPGAAAVVRGCTIVGTPGKDDITGTPGRDVICGGEGADTIRALGGNDVVYGGEGADRIEGGGGDDVLNGDFGNDRILGGAGADKIFMGHGDDDVFGGSGADVVDWSQSWSRGRFLAVIAEQDRDRIHGGGGADTLDGGLKRDFYFGDAGNDLFLTRDGATDHVVCGPGRDRMYSDTEDTATRDCEFVQPEA